MRIVFPLSFLRDSKGGKEVGDIESKADCRINRSVCVEGGSSASASPKDPMSLGPQGLQWHWTSLIEEPQKTELRSQFFGLSVFSALVCRV